MNMKFSQWCEHCGAKVEYSLLLFTSLGWLCYDCAEGHWKACLKCFEEQQDCKCSNS